MYIVSEYKDAYSKGEWCRQECSMPSIKACIETYGLGKDCSYRIISVDGKPCHIQG